MGGEAVDIVCIFGEIADARRGMTTTAVKKSILFVKKVRVKLPL